MREKARQRRGYTLLELLVVISLDSIICGLAVILVIALLHANRQSREHQHFGVVRARLVEQFCTDAQRALDILPVEQDIKQNAFKDNSADLQFGFTLPDGVSVEYQVEGDRIMRLERKTQKIVRRDQFTLPEASRVRFERIEDEKLPGWVRLSIDRPDDAQGYPPHKSFQIMARLSSDHRLSRPAGDKKP